MFQIKDQDRTPELSEMEIGNLPKKQFRVMILKMRNQKFLTKRIYKEQQKR